MNTNIVTSHRTVCAHLHIVGKGELPHLVREALSALITANGVATRALLTLCRNGLVCTRDDETNALISATLTLPGRKDKYGRLAELARSGATVQDGRIRYEGNSYRIIRFTPETGMFTVQVLLRYQKVMGVNPEHPAAPKGADTAVTLQSITDRLPANFLQAVFTSFLELPFSGMPTIVVKPALKQAAEQMLSYLLLLAGEEQEAEPPNTMERDPAQRQYDWKRTIRALTQRTEPMEFVRARDLDPRAHAEDDPRGNRLVNVTPEWAAFAESPFPRRLPLKIPPEFCAVFRRKTDGHAKIPERLYLGIRMFDGAGEDTELGALARCEKLFWWHARHNEFAPLSSQGKSNLAHRPKLLMVPLEYDREGRFEAGIGEGRKLCLVTLKEHRNNRPGRKGHRRASVLQTGEHLWRADVATSAEVSVPEWNGRVLGLHFADEPVITWALAEKSGAILEEGNLIGNPALQKGLAEKEKLELLQRRGKWTERAFAAANKTLTHELARSVVFLAVQKNAALALEDITWVDKRGGESVANRRFSMWNFARLKTLIEWLSTDIATREAVLPTRVVAYVSDYLTRYTCPQCGACRKAKQEKEKADTWREKDELHCRTCGFKGVIPDDAVARLVALKGLEFARTRKKNS